MSQKLALIIGNSEYKDTNLARLVTPSADVHDLAGVLRDPKIGSFDQVTTLVNQPCATIQRAIACFFAGKKREDLLLLYFSGHGVLDDRGRLYMAVQNTECDLLSATAIEASFITDEMDRSRSRRQVLILDCCHSGAFARGTKGALGASVGTASAFEGTGYGRVVLTATDSTQYAWEGDQVIGEAENSLFSHYLIQGIRTGQADTDADGRITLDELYEYVYERVVTETPRQTPGKWAYKQQGGIVIASNPHTVVKPAELPSELLQTIEDPRRWVRESGVRELGRLLLGSNKGLALAAQEALKRLKDDDSRQVSTAAADILERYDESQGAKEEYVAEAEWLSPEKVKTKRLISEKAGVDRKVAGKAEKEYVAEVERLAPEKVEPKRLEFEKAVMERKVSGKAEREAKQLVATAEIAKKKRNVAMKDEVAAKELVPIAGTAKKIWRPILLTSMGWGIGGGIGGIIGGGIGWVITYAINWAIGKAIFEAIGGLITGLTLRQAEPSITWKQITIVSLGWACGGSIGGVITYAIDWAIGKAIFEAICWAICVAFGGLITGIILRQAEPSITWKQVYIISLGWAIGGAVGWAIFKAIFKAIFEGISIDPIIGFTVGFPIIRAIHGAIIGAIGGGIMFWQLSRVHRRA